MVHGGSSSSSSSSSALPLVVDRPVVTNALGNPDLDPMMDLDDAPDIGFADPFEGPADDDFVEVFTGGGIGSEAVPEAGVRCS